MQMAKALRAGRGGWERVRWRRGTGSGTKPRPLASSLLLLSQNPRGWGRVAPGVEIKRQGRRHERGSSRGGARGDAGFPGPGRAGGTGRTGAGERGWLPGSLRLPNHPGKGAGTWEPRHAPPSAAGTTRTSLGRAGTHRHLGSQGNPTAADPGSGSIFITVIFFFLARPPRKSARAQIPTVSRFHRRFAKGKVLPPALPCAKHRPSRLSPRPHRPVPSSRQPSQGKTCRIQLGGARRPLTPQSPKKAKAAAVLGGRKVPKINPKQEMFLPPHLSTAETPPQQEQPPLPVPLPAWARQARY